MSKKTNTKPVIASAKPATAKPVTEKPEVTKRSRDSVLVSTTPAKLAELIGNDGVVLVSRKHLRNVITKDAAAKALAGL